MKRRRDGRTNDQLRPLSAEFSVLAAADGSARLTCGDTSVLAAVYGPRPARSSKLELPDRGLLEVIVKPVSGARGAWWRRDGGSCLHAGVHWAWARGAVRADEANPKLHARC